MRLNHWVKKILNIQLCLKNVINQFYQMDGIVQVKKELRSFSVKSKTNYSLEPLFINSIHQLSKLI